MMFLEDYVDTMDSLPAELARNFTLIKELDALSHDCVQRVRSDTEHFLEKVQAMDKKDRTEWLQRLAKDFKEALRHGEEKVALASQTYEMVDRHIRRMDEDLARYDEEQLAASRAAVARQHERPRGDQQVYREPYQQYEEYGRKRRDSGFDLDDQGAIVAEMVPTPNKKVKMNEGARRGMDRGSPEMSMKMTGRKMMAQEAKRNKVKKVNSAKGVNDFAELVPYRDEIPIDPNEPTYCLCGRVSFGEMIACDDDECEIEWFHYECVGLTAPLKSKAKWYCPACTAKRNKARK